MKHSLSPQTFTDRRMGFAILRLMLGINMLGRSIVRLPEIQEFASGMADGFADTFLPGPFVYVFGFVVVITETIIGVLLILGWKTRWALVTMGILLCSLAFGVILQQNFGTAANIMIYGIGVCLLLFHTEYDHFGIDRGFTFKGRSDA
jgi:thiosulfate dehydrogenase (quinone) large subunit